MISWFQICILQIEIFSVKLVISRKKSLFRSWKYKAVFVSWNVSRKGFLNLRDLLVWCNFTYFHDFFFNIFFSLFFGNAYLNFDNFSITRYILRSFFQIRHPLNTFSRLRSPRSWPHSRPQSWSPSWGSTMYHRIIFWRNWRGSMHWRWPMGCPMGRPLGSNLRLGEAIGARTRRLPRGRVCRIVVHLRPLLRGL